MLHYRTQLKFHRQTVKMDCFTQDSLVNEPLSPERIFKEFSLKMCYLKILILQIVYCDKKKNVSAGDRRKKHIVVTPKMTLIETFLARALYTIVILKLYICKCRFKHDFSRWSYVFVINITREVKSLRICFSIYTLLSIHAQNAFQS